MSNITFCKLFHAPSESSRGSTPLDSMAYSILGSFQMCHMLISTPPMANHKHFPDAWSCLRRR